MDTTSTGGLRDLVGLSAGLAHHLADEERAKRRGQQTEDDCVVSDQR